LIVVRKNTVILSRFSKEPENLLLNLPLVGRLHKQGIKWCFILVTLAFQGSSVLFAQQSTLMTHYMFMNMAINPAFAGNNGGINITGLARQQWIGWKDADGTKSTPQNYLLTVDSPLKILHGGLGGSVSQDQNGHFKNIELKLGYAYKMELGSGDLSIGLQGNLHSIGFDFSKLSNSSSEDPDPVLSENNGKASAMALDLGLGVCYKVPDKYYVGFSVDNLAQTGIEKLHYTLRRTYYLAGGYQWLLPDHPAFELLPSALMMYDGAVFQLNASALLKYNNKFYGGLGYRYQDAVSVLAGFSLKNFQIGVAYDICTSTMRHYNSGGLEVMVNYCFKISMDKYRKSYRNTRFL